MPWVRLYELDHKAACSVGCPSRVTIDKTQSEHKESAHAPIADIGADIDLRRDGPGETLRPLPRAPATGVASFESSQRDVPNSQSLQLGALVLSASIALR